MKIFQSDPRATHLLSEQTLKIGTHSKHPLKRTESLLVPKKNNRRR